MSLRNWYNCGTKHFHLTSVVRWKWKNQLHWVIKPVPHDLVRRIRLWRIKISGTWFEYLYWRISKIFFRYLFSCMGTYMIDWVGRTGSCHVLVCDRLSNWLLPVWGHVIRMKTSCRMTGSCHRLVCDGLPHELLPVSSWRRATTKVWAREAGREGESGLVRVCVCACV